MSSRKCATSIRIGAALALCGLISAAGAIVGASATGAQAHSSRAVLTASQSSDAQPGIPPTGAYLGAWINPDRITKGQIGNVGAPGTEEIQRLASFRQSNGRALAILHVYTPFTKPLPSSTLQSINKSGAVPLVDWSCSNVNSVASGHDDALIKSYAESLKSYGHPVFLRWYQEMNLNSKMNSKCDGYGNGSAYVAAWQHIWNIFHSVGTKNVAFVWCPSVKSDASAYYPGNKYVTWIAVDGYVRKNAPADFAQLFGPFYRQWAGNGKPLMVAETGAPPAGQAQFIASIQSEVPKQFPDIKAVVYFDSNAGGGVWSLQGSGAAAFRSLSADPYFAYHST